MTVATQSGDMTAAFSSALESAASTPVAEASPASTPETTTPATEPSAPAATTQAAAETTPPASASPESQEPKKGEPPPWRWQDILANTRETVAKETEDRIRQEVEQQYQWAKEVAEHERDGLLTWRAAMNGDPRAIALIKANPQAVAWLTGLVTEPQQPAADPEPEPDLQTADGQLVYSAARQKEWREWNNRQLTTTLRQEFQKELQPIKQEREQAQWEGAKAAYTSATEQAVRALAAKDPTFDAKKYGPDVFAVISADPHLLNLALAPETAPFAISYAWGEVHREKVLPSLQQRNEQQVLADLQQRAAAGSVNPSTPSNTTPKTFGKGGEEAFREALTHFSAAGTR